MKQPPYEGPGVGGAKSTLGSLFRYAATGGIENFTTEALAAAVRDDASPLVAALQKIGVELSVPLVRVHTQYAIDGGILDLVLVPQHGPALIIEVKIDAGESGNQLDRYLAWCTNHPEDGRPSVVVLSASRLSDNEQVPWLRWQVLWNELRERPAGSRWADIRRWLEECGMADDSLEPATQAEARALRSAHSLLKRTIKILIEPSIKMNSAWPGSNWPTTEADVKKQLVSRFGTWPSFSIQHREVTYGSGCSMGVYENESEGACLSLWLWAPLQKAEVRSIIESVAAALPSTWKSDRHSGEPLRADKRLVEFSAQAEATRWLLDRIEELERVGIFKVFDAAKAGSGSGSKAAEFDENQE